jgi:hypothetical protein
MLKQSEIKMQEKKAGMIANMQNRQRRCDGVQAFSG